jgi:hypothetical protein
LKDIESAWSRKISGYVLKQREAQTAMIEEAVNTGDTEALVEAAEVVPDVTLRDVWKFRITDPDKIPREFLIPDEAAIGKVVRAMKGKTKIEGVAVYNEPIVPKKRGG